MKRLIITVLMMCFAQGAFGSNNELNRRLIKNLEQQVKALKDGNQELKKSVLARLSAIERAYVLRRALTGAKIQLTINSPTGETFNISIPKNATVRELKQQIAKLRDLLAVTIELYVKDDEDALPNSSLLVVLNLQVMQLFIC